MSGEGGNGPSAGAAEPPTGRRPATSLLTWGAAATILVIAIVLVVLKITGTRTAPTAGAPVQPTPAPSTVVKEVTSIPPSVYDAVGISSSVAAISPPLRLSGQPKLAAKGKPEVVFVADEFCAYCAAERWALVAALARFGHFEVLNSMQSASNMVFPNTPTFTFNGSRYTSRYVTADLVEHYGSEKDGAGTAYAVVNPVPPHVQSLMRRFDPPTPEAPGGIVPFLDVANRAISVGGGFSPSILELLSANQIAAGLVDANDPVTQAIVATSNEISAAICAVDGGAPAKVCSSRGVAAASTPLAPIP